jgi:predicted small metal-binding protein
MKKHLTCRALGMNCGFEVHDESEGEITVAIGDHLKRVHGVEFTDALRRKAMDLILLDPA